MASSKKQEWVALYEEALLESDEKPFLVRALLAKRAMVDRLQDFGITGRQPPERNDLLRAVINLRTLETEIRNPNRSASALGNVRLADDIRSETVHPMLETDRSRPDDRWKRLWIVERH